MNYGLQHRYYAKPLAGWPPQQFPLGHSLGQVFVDSGDPNCAAGMPYDVNGNPCPGSTVTPAPAPAPVATTAGAPTGSTLIYTGTWEISLDVPGSGAQILGQVTQNLKADPTTGFQVGAASTTSGFFTVNSFDVQIALFVSGPGFAQPNDAGNIVDHAYYQVTGRMPLRSNTAVKAGTIPTGVSTPAAPTTTGGPAGPGGSSSSCLPGYTLNISGQCLPTTMSQWFQQNAGWIVLAGVAAIALPRLL